MPQSPYPILFTWIVILTVSAVLGTAAQLLRPHPLPWMESRAGRLHKMATELDIPTATPESVQQAIDSGSCLIFDARPPELFAQGHLPTALSFPNADRDRFYQDFAPILTPDQEIVVYCSESACDDALELAKFLRRMGHEHITLFTGGIAEWTDRRFPLAQ